jgi:enoyl-CoA hydratase/carnithine racemase
MGFPEINLGIMPGAGGTIRAPRLVGESRAKELILLGDIIDADKAEAVGLVNKVTEKEMLMETVFKWAEKLCKKAPIAVTVAKNTIDKGLGELDIEDAINIEAESWSKLFSTYDQKEGMLAFIEKRKPVYKGK